MSHAHMERKLMRNRNGHVHGQAMPWGDFAVLEHLLAHLFLGGLGGCLAGCEAFPPPLLMTTVCCSEAETCGRAKRGPSMARLYRCVALQRFNTSSPLSPSAASGVASPSLLIARHSLLPS